jgi:DNA adenine methylase
VEAAAGKINHAPGNYLGRKGGSGIAQWIINKMPRHDVYIEPFFGTGVVGFTKRPGNIANIGYEISAKLCSELSGLDHHFALYNGDALDLLPDDIDRFIDAGHRILIYLDPPYLPETRKDYAGSQYENELTREEHWHLLQLLLVYGRRDNVYVIVSGYKSPLYDTMLRQWPHYDEFQTMSRGGPRTESLWCNFDPAAYTKHQHDFIGDGYTDRQRIKRKHDRWLKNLAAMPKDERDMIVRSIIDRYGFVSAAQTPML